MLLRRDPREVATRGDPNDFHAGGSCLFLKQLVVVQGATLKLSSIRAHLRPYSLIQKRRTTIHHAFASALAPCDPYDLERLKRAMSILRQVDLDNLTCVYCRKDAKTWDHLIGLVKDSELSGYGHQLGNLVPSCRDCNSKKGNNDWRTFIAAAIDDPKQRREVEQMLAAYLAEFAVEIDLDRTQSAFPEEWKRYVEIKRQVLSLMAEADELAKLLRLKTD